MIQLNYRDSRPIYEQIKDGFRKLIMQGVMKADEKLPSVREMATTLTINPNTIQRAYRELEQEGYVYMVAGKGSFVAGVPKADEKRKKELWNVFDSTVEELRFLGTTVEEMTEHLKKM